MHVPTKFQHHVPIVRRQEKGRRLVWHARRPRLFAIAIACVVLDVVVQNAFDKVQEPCPNNREGMARCDLSLGDAVYRGSCLGFGRTQDLVGHPNHLTEACSRQPWMINGLSCSDFDDTTATYIRSRRLQVQE